LKKSSGSLSFPACNYVSSAPSIDIDFLCLCSLPWVPSFSSPNFKSLSLGWTAESAFLFY
jgi:hypothetical protein